MWIAVCILAGLSLAFGEPPSPRDGSDCATFTVISVETIPIFLCEPSKQALYPNDALSTESDFDALSTESDFRDVRPWEVAPSAPLVYTHTVAEVAAIVTYIAIIAVVVQLPEYMCRRVFT